MCWVSSKLITRIIRSSELHHRQPIPSGTPPKFVWNRGAVARFSRKPAIYLKRGKTEPKILLTTNRKLHTRFRFVPKSVTLDDLERPFRTLFQNTCVFPAHYENLNEEIGPYYEQKRCSAMTVRFMRIFVGVIGEGASNDCGVIENVDFRGFRTLRQHYYLVLLSPLSPFD